jgi:hypothetical protein
MQFSYQMYILFFLHVSERYPDDEDRVGYRNFRLFAVSRGCQFARM